MQARPRKAENRCAEELTMTVQDLGIDFVFKRVPVIGRRGPDLSWPNPLGLAIDVKSRLSVPKWLYQLEVFYTPRYFICGLDTLADALRIDWLLSGDWEELSFTSKLVDAFYDHMAGWDRIGDGIPALILHRPGSPYKAARFVIHREDKDRLLIAIGQAIIDQIEEA